jgi:hypothetical protein
MRFLFISVFLKRNKIEKWPDRKRAGPQPRQAIAWRGFGDHPRGF